MTDFVEKRGNLLEADVDALVNTVNTVGVMGKGIALQFKRAFPPNFKAYEAACKADQVRIGKMFVFDNGGLTLPHWLVNFPTKGHWRSKSKIEDIQAGLQDLAEVVSRLEISSLAIPPLGCGNGGLDWTDVESLIRQELEGLDVAVQLFVPAGPPAAASMPVATHPPSLTKGRAALIEILARYSQASLGASLIEVQKLMYFLQEAGEPLRLRYKKGIYGPYADNLRQVLVKLEGHYLQGYGDGSRAVNDSEPLQVLPGAHTEAKDVLSELDDHDLNERIDRTLTLASGFESGYGLELLSSVHWCATRSPNVDSPERAADCVRSWTKRKETLFGLDDVTIAWDQLEANGWIPA